MKTRGVKLDFKPRTRPKRNTCITTLCDHVMRMFPATGGIVFTVQMLKVWCEARGFACRRAYDLIALFRALGMVVHTGCSSTFLWLGHDGFAKQVNSLHKFGFPNLKSQKKTLYIVTLGVLYANVVEKCATGNLETLKERMAALLHKDDFGRCPSACHRLYDAVSAVSCVKKRIGQ